MGVSPETTLESAPWRRPAGLALAMVAMLVGTSVAGLCASRGEPLHGPSEGAPYGPSAAPLARPGGAPLHRAGDQVEPPRWQVDLEDSELVVVLHKAGLLRFLGHEHGILARDWSARIRYDEDDLASSSIVVTVPVSALEIDSPAARAAADVDPGGPEGEDLEEIRAKMVGPEQLDADRYPEIRLESRRIEADGDDRLRIHADLTIHGQSRPVEVEASVRRQGGSLRIRGDFEIEHRDFGIEPVSIGGVVKVANEMDVRFDVLARPAPEAGG